MNQQESTVTDENPAPPLSLFIARLRFAFNNYRYPIILTGLFLFWFVIDMISGWQFLDSFKNRWNTDLDQIVSPATLMIALFVWYGEIAENWENNLPKRLTVRFENEQSQCNYSHPYKNPLLLKHYMIDFLHTNIPLSNETERLRFTTN